MARLPSAALHTLWILLFPYTANEVTAAGLVEEFACFTDYDKELVCHWKVPAQTNCSKEFLLYYRDESDQSLPPLNAETCVPENGEESLCSCTIYSDYFMSSQRYILALQFNGTDTWNHSVTPALVVKPRAPKNLTITKDENGNFNLSWKESYSPSSLLSGQPVIYEVKYWRKQHPTEVSVITINYQAKSFEITAGSLRRGYDYIASVRCNYTHYPAYWSEWSEEVEFHCDHRVTAEDILQVPVPVACILIMVAAVISYFCFTKVKKEWWDQIPNPAKSHLVVKNVKFSVLYYIDEIKFPFHDLKQSHMENKISCKNCLSQSLSSRSFKGNDSVRNVEKSCSCHSKSAEWLPQSSSAVLTPETESVEICECLTDTEGESQEETSDQLTMFEPCESSISAFTEHAEHNDVLARMFIGLLADENNLQDSKDPDFITGENKTFEKLESENLSQQNPKMSTAWRQQPHVSRGDSLFTKASQDDYNCSTASKKSEQSEESFESGYRSCSLNSAALDARELQQQSFFPCSSESQHDLRVLIQESPNKPSFGTNQEGISNPAYKSFDALMSSSLEPCASAYKSFDALVSPSMEPCASAYKSFDALLSPSMEPCASAYKSFDALVSPSMEPCASAYKSFNTLMSQSVANSSLTLCFEHVCSSSPRTQLLEMPELSCREQVSQPPGNQACYTNYRPACTELDFQNTSSEHCDFVSFSRHANDSASAFLPEEEIHQKVTYQNVQKKANRVSCPTEPQPSGYQPFDNACQCYSPNCESGNEVISRSLHEPFVHLLYNNLPDTMICQPKQRTDGHMCLMGQGFGCSTAPGLGSSENVTQSSDGSLWIINSNELSADSKDERTSSDEQLLRLSEQTCQDGNSREETIKRTKPTSFNSARKGMQESSSNRLNTDFHCHTHNHLGKLGSAGEEKEVMEHVAGRSCGSAASLPEESLDSLRLNLERQAAEPLELLVSEKLLPPLFVGDPYPSGSHTIHSEGSRLAAAVKKRPAELLRENRRKNEERMELVQALAQEENCYMKVA